MLSRSSTRTLFLLTLLAGSDAFGLYLSSRSRPAAINDPCGPQTLPHRRTLFDSGETLYFTTPAPLTEDQALALDAALAAWNSAPQSSIRVAYGGVAADNDDQFQPASPPCTLYSNDVNSIKLTSSNEAFCDGGETLSETVVGEPGFFLQWIRHSYCAIPDTCNDHWTIGGSRTLVRTAGLTGAGLARVLAHEIGMSLGFATTSEPGNVLNPNIDTSFSPPPYTVTLGSYDLEAAAAAYPAWEISAPQTVCGESAGNVASIVNAQANTVYTWTPHDGAVITSCGGTFVGNSCQGTSTVTFSAPPWEGLIFCIIGPCPQQSVGLTVTAARGCSGSGTTPTHDTAGEVRSFVVSGNYEVSPHAANFGPGAGTGTLQIRATQACANWTAVAPGGSFVAITSGASGNGNGTVQFSVAANSGAYARSTTLSVAGRAIEITQSGSGRGTIALTATAGSSQVNLNWTSIAGVTSYHVFRSSGGDELQYHVTVNGLAMTDDANNEVGYLYRVSAYDGDEYVAHSNVDLAVPFDYVDPTLTSTPIRAVHFLQLRNAIQDGRSAFGWPGVSFTGSITAGQPVQPSHLLELRTQLNLVRAGVGLAPPAYVDPSIVGGVTPVRAAHVLNLRDGLR